jgi:uncharacterized radical SAM superfamily protein
MTPVIVQLPFPSQTDPDERLVQYYRRYAEYFATIASGFALREGDLWEAPLWVAHLDAAIGREDTQFEDLSQMPVDVDACTEHLVRAVGRRPAVFLFSPLAQNLDLATAVSKRLIRWGHRTVLGGNMAGVADARSFSYVYSGLARRGIFDTLMSAPSGNTPKLGKQHANFGYGPNYRFLARFAKRVSMVRINASHGCLFGCAFCGDGWSRQLHVVSAESLAREFDDIAEHFPDVQLLYVGDKTFGQSSAAVENLIRTRPNDRYKFIAQTHVTAITDELLHQMQELGVVLLEMGFESADAGLLRSMKKSGTEDYLECIEKVRSRGIHVVLNLLGGLPGATEFGHRRTVRFLSEAGDHASLYNLYNFVPYPKTPIFGDLRSRIFDWNFANWREDRPVVFTPYNQTVEDLWEQFLDLVSTCELLVRRRLQRAYPESKFG